MLSFGWNFTKINIMKFLRYLIGIQQVVFSLVLRPMIKVQGLSCTLHLIRPLKA